MSGKSTFIIDRQDRRVELRLGSISELSGEVGAIVSDDDAWLSHAGSVAAAIWRTAGPALLAAVRTLPPLTTGDLHVTTAGELPAQLLFHAVTIDHETSHWVDDSRLRKLYVRAIEQAELRGLDSLVLPLLGTGAAGLSKEASAKALGSALTSWLRRPSDLTDVIVSVVDNGWEAALGGLSSVLSEVRVFGQGRPELDDEAITFVGSRSDGGATISQVRELELVLSEENAELVQEAQRSGRWTAISQSLSSDVQAAYEAEDPEAKRELPLGSQVELFLSLSADGNDVPRELETALRQAALERNRLAHGLNSEDRATQVADRLERAIHELRKLSPPTTSPAPVLDPDAITATQQRDDLPRPPGSAERFREHLEDERDEIPAAAGDATADSSPTASAPPRPPQEKANEGVRGSTEPVRRLHEYLSSKMDEPHVEQLLERLSIEGYVGEADLQLLEFCVRVENPAAFLASEFSARELREHVTELTGQKPNAKADARDLSWQLLREMGFHEPAVPSGLGAALAAAQHARRRLTLAEAPELRGVVVELSRHVEYMTLVLLQFICAAAFGRPAAAFLRETGLLEASYSLHRCSLGRLVELLERVGTELEHSELERARLLRQDLCGRSLFPKGATDLAGLRNAFAHYKERTSDTSLADLRSAAQDFVGQASALFEHLGADEGRIFPQVIAIRSIQLDRFGRRIVEAVNDSGLTETIFTDSPLQPGGLYFMHARSSPVAVYPLLVPAGDLRWSRT